MHRGLLRIATVSMRLLVVSNEPFAPPTAGNRQRLGQLIDHLRGHGVAIALLLVPGFEMEKWDMAAMRARVDCLELAAPPPRIPGVARLRRLFATRRRANAPIGVDDWCPGWVRRHAARLARNWRPDAVLVEYVFLSRCLEVVPAGTLRIVDTHDVMHRRQAVYAAAGAQVEWFHTSVEEEQRGLRRAGVVLAIQDEEARALSEMVPEVTVITVPPGRQLALQPLEAAEPLRLLLVASYNELNVRGLRWFLEAVWPRLREAIPGVTVEVCGNIDQKIGAVPNGVTMRGVVADLAASYARARVVIDPVPAATGVQLKVVDALCHGRPVVATPAGGSGLESIAGRGLSIAPDARAFAAEVRLLLEEEARWASAARAAGAIAAERFSAEVAFRPLMDLIETAARRTH